LGIPTSISSSFARLGHEPWNLNIYSLSEALVQLGKEFERSAPETARTLDMGTKLPTLSPDIAAALYRVAQEVLTNIRKHPTSAKCCCTCATRMACRIKGSELQPTMVFGLLKVLGLSACASTSNY
jgi:signal transduction histidine kinase